jgi:aspartate aminotransferase
MPALAKRLARARVADTTVMTNMVRAMREAGIDVIQFTIGEPDFATPPNAIEAAHQAALAGETKYPPVDGTKRLKEAVQRKFHREHGLDFPLDQIMVANGGKQALYDAMMSIVDEGDEVIIPAPYWNSYPLMVRFVGGEPVFVTCPQNNGFRLRAEDLEAAITPRTKALLLNFPNNPTGAACTAEDLKAVAEVMLRHPDIWILSDDMYEHLMYADFRYTTIAAVEPRLLDRTVTISGVSKTYAMTGWRVGFAAGPKELIRAMVNIQGQVSSGISTVGQAAAAAMLDGPQDVVATQAAAYRRRRDLVVDALNAMPGVNCHRPEGAFYVFPNVAGCIGRTTPGGKRIENDTDLAMALIEEAHVALIAGAAFGMSPYLRISYASDEASLAEGCRRMDRFMRALH